MYKEAKVDICKYTFPGVSPSHFSLCEHTYICVYVHIHTDMNAVTAIDDREKPRLFGRVLV